MERLVGRGVEKERGIQRLVGGDVADPAANGNDVHTVAATDPQIHHGTADEAGGDAQFCDGEAFGEGNEFSEALGDDALCDAAAHFFFGVDDFAGADDAEDFGVEVGGCAGDDAGDADLAEERGGEDAIFNVVVADSDNREGHLVDTCVAESGFAGAIEAEGVIHELRDLFDEFAVLIDGEYGDVAASEAACDFHTEAAEAYNCTFNAHSEVEVKG